MLNPWQFPVWRFDTKFIQQKAEREVNSSKGKFEIVIKESLRACFDFHENQKNIDQIHDQRVDCFYNKSVNPDEIGDFLLEEKIDFGVDSNMSFLKISDLTNIIENNEKEHLKNENLLDLKAVVFEELLKGLTFESIEHLLKNKETSKNGKINNQVAFETAKTDDFSLKRNSESVKNLEMYMMKKILGI